MILIIGSLIVGLIIGFLGQRSRMCFIGGFRDFFIVKDKELLKGIISFFASAWLCIQILFLISKLSEKFQIFNLKNVVYPGFISAILSKFGLISLIGGFGLGLFSTLSGACPMRHHVLAGQGRVDSIVYLLGFYTGIIIYYVFLIKFISIYL